MEQLKQFFEDKSIQTLLDVGTGSGDFITVLKETFDKTKFTGIDPDKSSLEEAAKVHPDVEFMNMTGEKLEFADSTFDAASISMAMHHLPDVQLTFKEMQRVVKPDGWIIVNELFSDNLNPAQEVHKQMHHFRSTIDRLNGVCHNETFTRAEITEKIEKAGLKIYTAFNNDKALVSPTAEEIAERKDKLTEMLEQVKDKPEYDQLKNQIPAIEAALKQHGFQMATRVVVIAKVEKD
ncbi:class I SAM-dependent methyltransferase [Draconibacterium sp. IB214405]|uniref:class I SAM-dependent methyltransferase n=1 Tax=Draconibacterium sp. IB214405 TaxID=3097352 RepID=UPI002A16F444|nr:class I SAM-dependent methyltransferase [Draconibacterium sp. IB214405]MDX8338251.1 class I SAM-dependent methyltransferase [Draconibacterium sp. IB214405]